MHDELASLQHVCRTHYLQQACATGLCSFDRFPPPPAVAHRENAICRHISHFESYLVLDDAFL